MHAYTGVDCKECKKFIALRRVAPGADASQLAGEFRLSCANGHKNTYTAGEFYTLESSVPYALPVRANPRDREPKALLFVALVLALLMLVAWLVVSVISR